MKTIEEIKAKIKELEDDRDWSEDPRNNFSDPWEDVPVINAQIDILKWILNEETI
jgi:hypothetical protein